MANDPETFRAYREIIERLDKLRDDGGEKPPALPLIDPSANVLKLLEQAMQRQDDLRNTGEKYSRDLRLTKEKCDKETAELREKLANAESKRLDATNLAESRRIDALFAKMGADVALASEKSAAGAAQLAQSVVVAAQTNATALETMRAGFDPRVTRLEQQQYQTGGRDIQRGEERGQKTASNASVLGWVGLGLGTFIGLAGLLYAMLKP